MEIEEKNLKKKLFNEVYKILNKKDNLKITHVIMNIEILMISKFGTILAVIFLNYEKMKVILIFFSLRMIKKNVFV